MENSQVNIFNRRSGSIQNDISSLIESQGQITPRLGNSGQVSQ